MPTLRTDTISITDLPAVLDAGYEAIAKSNGWTATVKDADGESIPNPQTAKEVAINVTRRFWGETIRAYNAAQAMEQARVAAIAATEAATSNTQVTLTTGS